MVQIDSGGKYVLTNAKSSGVAVDLSGTDNKSIIGYPKHGGPNQQWEFIRVQDGWHIRNVRAGTFIAFEGGSHDGTHLVATEQPFVWDIWPDKNDSEGYRISAPNTNKDVDLSNHGDPTPGNPVALYGRWEGSVNQVWHVERVG